MSGSTNFGACLVGYGDVVVRYSRFLSKNGRFGLGGWLGWLRWVKSRGVTWVYAFCLLSGWVVLGLRHERPLASLLRRNQLWWFVIGVDPFLVGTNTVSDPLIERAYYARLKAELLMLAGSS